jgi:hypothetical protein
MFCGFSELAQAAGAKCLSLIFLYEPRLISNKQNMTIDIF